MAENVIYQTRPAEPALYQTTDIQLMRYWHDALAELQHVMKGHMSGVLAVDPALDPVIEKVGRLLVEVQRRKLRARMSMWV